MTEKVVKEKGPYLTHHLPLRLLVFALLTPTPAHKYGLVWLVNASLRTWELQKLQSWGFNTSFGSSFILFSFWVVLMATVEMSRMDLECGCYVGDDGTGTDDDSSVCFSDAEEGSCYSQFYSTADGDGSYDDEIMELPIESRRVSSVESVADSDCSVDVTSRVAETKVRSEKQEKDCRICQLSLVSSGPEYGIAIELGCSCKDDLAAAHKHCAETWFKIKGNKTCEICNSIARNVAGANDIESGQQTTETGSTRTTTSDQGDATTETPRSCFEGRFVNFFLACVVFAFVLSWLFHFNVRS